MRSSDRDGETRRPNRQTTRTRTMDGVLSPQGVHKLTRSLSCLARFGETVTLLALPSELVLTTLSSSKTAHAKITFSSSFFSSYTLSTLTPRKGLTADLNIKALLHVLRVRTGEKLDTCCLGLRDEEQMKGGGKRTGGRVRGKRRRIERGRTEDDDDEVGEARGSEGEGEEEEEGGRKDQPRFEVQLSFPGMTKLHTLQIATSHIALSPLVPNLASHFTTSAKSVLGWMESFPSWAAQAGARETKEAFLAWAFDKDGVRISTWAANAKAEQLSTECLVPSDEFESFYLSPEFTSTAERKAQTLGFPMREFKAVTYLALSLSLPIHIKFSTAFQPLSITLPSSSVEDEESEVGAYEFLIMTRDVKGLLRAEGSGGVGKGASKGKKGLKLEGGGEISQASSSRRADEHDQEEREEGHPAVDDQAREASYEEGGGMEYQPPEEEEDAVRPRSARNASAGPSTQARPTTLGRHPPQKGDLTFSHPQGHSTPLPAAAKEPLFYPGPATQTQSQPPLTLTQAQLAEFGLEGLDELDFDMGEEDEWDVAGEVVGEGGEVDPSGAGGEEGGGGGTQIGMTQVQGEGRAFTRFAGGESDSDVDEDEGPAGQQGSETEREKEGEGTYEMSVDV